MIVNPELRSRDARSLRRAFTRHFLATEAGSEVGLISVDLLPAAERLILYEIFVSTALRVQGIGAKLLWAAEEMAKGLSFELMLLVSKSLDKGFEQQALEDWYARQRYVPLQDSSNGAVVKRIV